MKVRDVVKYINIFADERYQYDWDNSGLQLGNKKNDVEKIMVTLDVTDEVIDEAIREGVDKIVSHHPFFFTGFKTIEQNTVKGNMIYKLIQNNISVYSTHTPMDVSRIGLNVYMAEKLGLKNITTLEKVDPKGADEQNLFGLGAVGTLESEIKMDKFLKKVKKVYGTDIIKVSENYKSLKKVRKVGLCAGSGADLIDKVNRKNADVFITSDAKYHEIQDYVDHDLVLMVVGHYDAEICFVDIMKELLSMNFKDVEIIKSKEKNVEAFAYII